MFFSDLKNFVGFLKILKSLKVVFWLVNIVVIGVAGIFVKK